MFKSLILTSMNPLLTSLILTNVGDEFHYLSLGSLRQVVVCLIDMNQEVARVILECKKGIWNNQDSFGLVQDYFEYSVQSLDFFYCP
jgi:uncharacterized protein DUF677